MSEERNYEWSREREFEFQGYCKTLANRLGNLVFNNLLNPKLDRYSLRLEGSTPLSPNGDKPIFLGFDFRIMGAQGPLGSGPQLQIWKFWLEISETNESGEPIRQRARVLELEKKWARWNIYVSNNPLDRNIHAGIPESDRIIVTDLEIAREWAHASYSLKIAE